MIPTAEEFVNQYDWENSSLNIPQVLIEFAKLHVTEALKKASKNVYLTGDSESTLYCRCSIDKDSILNAYPLTNIK